MARRCFQILLKSGSMRPEAFSEARTGRVVPAAGTGITHAFVPDPLPPSWPWPDRLWPVLLEAHKALAALDGTGRHLPDPDLVLRPLQDREAQKSSSLEGTVTDPQQQMLFELDPMNPGTNDERVSAHREVANYSKALRLQRAAPEPVPLSLRFIRKLHAVLMDGVRGADKNPGNFRRGQNQIGRPARYVPPPVNELSRSLDSFEKYMHADRKYDPLVEAFILHYQFEAIHPFMDGNGRVGRLLLALTIAEWCELASQWLYMSAYFDRNKDEYIDRLLRVSTHGDWEGWVEFCLRGVVEECRDTSHRCDELIELNRAFHQRANEAGGSVRLTGIIDGLFMRPVVSVTSVRERFGVTYPTARSDLNKLETLGIISLIPEARTISYYSEPIFHVIYAG
jgi:Fic family protein